MLKNKLIVSNINQDFSENDIELSKWKGSLELRNLNIKDDYIRDIGIKIGKRILINNLKNTNEIYKQIYIIFYQIGFPLVKMNNSANIEKLQISIPWKRIRSEPIIIKIRGVKVVCCTTDTFSKYFYEKRLANKKYVILQQLIKQIEQDIQKKKSEKFNTKDDLNENLFDEDDDDEKEKIKVKLNEQDIGQGNFIKKQMSAYSNYLNQIKDIILQNIRIEIEDLELKLEDNEIATQNSYMQIGIAFEKLLISPANSEFQPTFINPEQVKKEQKKYQIYKLTGFEIFGSQLDFDKQYILHPVNIDIQKVRNNNQEELKTHPRKSTKIIISSVKIELFENQFKHIRNILKYKNWHCEMGLTLFLRPKYTQQVQGNAKKWLDYLFQSLKTRALMKHYTPQARTILDCIQRYIEIYKEKLEFELEQKMAAKQFINSNYNLNELQIQEGISSFTQRRIDINDVEKSIEEQEKQLLMYPITPTDIIKYRDVARHQIHKEQSAKFDKLLKLKKKNKLKQQKDKQKAKTLFQKALQQEKIQSLFGWITSKIRRKSSVSSVSSSNNEDVLQLNEEEEQEEILKQEFKQFIESYTENQAQNITDESMKGQTYIKSKLSVEFEDSIQISLMTVTSNKSNNRNSRSNKNNYAFQMPSNRSNHHNHQNKHQREEFFDTNFELLHLKINISQCFKISTNINTMIRFVIQDFQCRHTINPSEFFQNTVRNLDNDVNKPSLQLQLVRQKNTSTNQVSYRFSSNIASHQFILTDVFFTSIMSFFSMKQKSRSFLSDFNVKTKQVKKQIDLYLAEQIRNLFGHKILFDKIDVKCGKFKFLFPEKFSYTNKPLVEFEIESFFVSNKQIERSKLKSILEKDRMKYKYQLENKENNNNNDNSNLYVQALDNLKESHITQNNIAEQSLYKSFKDSEMMHSFQNGQSQMTYRTDQFHSILDFNPAINQSKIENNDEFYELNSVAEDARSDQGLDSEYRYEKNNNNNQSYLQNQSFANQNNSIKDSQNGRFFKSVEIEQKITKKLLEKGYFMRQSLKNSNMLNDSKFDNLSINFTVSSISTHYCQYGLESKDNQKIKILQDFFIESSIKRAFQHQPFNVEDSPESMLPMRCKSQENRLNEIQTPLYSERLQEKKTLGKKKQTVSLDDFQNQMIGELNGKNYFFSKVQITVDMNINLIAINIYHDIHCNLMKIIKQYKKIFITKEKQENENINNGDQIMIEPFQHNNIKENQIEEERNGESEDFKNSPNFAKNAFGSPLGSPQNPQNEDISALQTLQNRLNTTYLSQRDEEEFFDAVEDFSQFFKHQSMMYQPTYAWEKNHMYSHQDMHMQKISGEINNNRNSIKYSSEELKKKMDIIRQARTQSYIGLLHHQYLREKMNKRSSKFFQTQEDEIVEQLNQNQDAEEYFNQLDNKPSQQSFDDEQQDDSVYDVENVQNLSLRDLITFNFKFNLEQFRIYIMSSVNNNEQQKQEKQDQQQQQKTEDNNNDKQRQIIPKKSSALIIQNLHLSVTFKPTSSNQSEIENLQSNKKYQNARCSQSSQSGGQEFNDGETEVKSINLDPQQCFQQQILQLKTDVIKSDEFLENSNRLNRRKSQSSGRNEKISHKVQIDIKLEDVYISIYKLEKILSIIKPENEDEQSTNKDAGQQKVNGEANKVGEVKDYKIFNNLKTILLIKDSEVDLSFGLQKCSLKFQDIRKQIKEFSEFVEFSVEDVKLETDTLVPIKFDFSELRYIDQLENIMNYVQYKIKFGWLFNASYTNMSNKQIEPFVEEMNQNYKKDIIYECLNDIQLNFHPALIDNIFILQQSFMKLNKKDNSNNKISSKKKLKEQQTDYSYEISNQTGITFQIKFFGNVTSSSKNVENPNENKNNQNSTGEKSNKNKQNFNKNNNINNLLTNKFNGINKGLQDAIYIKAKNSCELKPNDVFLLNFKERQVNKRKNIDKSQDKDENSSNTKQYTKHEIKVIFNKKETTIDLLQSQDTYIQIKNDFYIVCQPITYDDRKIVFRSNIKITNLTNYNLDFLLSNVSSESERKSPQSNKNNLQKAKQLISQSQDIELKVNKFNSQYVPFQLFYKKYIQVKDQQEKFQYSSSSLFKNNLQNFIPIIIYTDTSSDEVSSPTLYNNNLGENEQDKNNNKELEIDHVLQSYLIIRRLRSENQLSSQDTTGGVQNTQYLSTEPREIQIIVQYPILIHNLNPLPIDVSFMYPKHYDNFSDDKLKIQYIAYKLLNENKSLDEEDVAEQFNQEFDNNPTDDMIWNKKFNYNKHKLILQAGQSSYLSTFNTFLMCKLSVDLQNYCQFKPLEIFDSKTIQEFQEFFITSQIYFSQQQSEQRSKQDDNQNELFNDEDEEQNNKQNQKQQQDEQESMIHDDEQNLSLLQSNTSSQFQQLQKQQYMRQLQMMNQLPKNPLLDPIIKQKILQLLNKDGQQLNLIFDIKYSYECMLEITIKSQFWFLNETEISLDLLIQENRYLYPKIPLEHKLIENSHNQIKIQFGNQQGYSMQNSTALSKMQSNYTSSQYQNSINTPKEEMKKRDKRQNNNFDMVSSQTSGKKSPLAKNKFQSAEKLNEIKNMFVSSEQPYVNKFDDGNAQSEIDKPKAKENQLDSDIHSIKNRYFGVNSNNFSLEKVEELFQSQSLNIQLFTGNFTSEKRFKLEIPLDQIAALQYVKPYNNTNNGDDNIGKNYQTDYLDLQDKNTRINFNNLKYLSMQINQVQLPDKFKEIKFYIITPLFLIKNSSNHSLSVNQFISSSQSSESSLAPNQTRQLIYDQVKYPYIQLKPAHNFSLWSQKFPIDKPIQFIIKINHINKSNSFILLRITISKESSLYLITIEDTNEYPPFKIVNLTNEELAISQKNFQGQSLFVKMQSDPKDMNNNMIYNEKLIDHFLKNFSPFGWDDPFGEETMIISTVDTLLCNLTKKDFQENNQTKVIRQFDGDDIVIKIFQDKEYPKTRIILIMYERNKKLFDEYKFEENIYQNLTFHLHLKRFGISIVDSYPREILYFSMDNIQLLLKQLNKRIEVQIEVQDVQGDYQAAKPLPTPFLVTKKVINKDRLDKQNKKKQGDIQESQHKNILAQTPTFFSKIFQKLSSFLSKKPQNQLNTNQIELKNITSNTTNPTRLSINLNQLNTINTEYTQDRLTTYQNPTSGCVTPITNTNKSGLNQMALNSAILRSQQQSQQFNPFGQKQSKYKSFFKLNYIQQYYQSTKTSHIEKFKVELQPIEINIDGGLVHRVIKFVNEIKTLLQKHPKFKNGKDEQGEDDDRIKNRQSISKMFMQNPIQRKKNKKIKKQDQTLHFMIERFDILPISVDIKFSNLHTSQISMDSSNMLYFIMILLNLIGSNKFYFEKFNDENHLYSLSNLIRKIVNHYSTSIENQLFNIIANANLIGNPGQLFKEIGFAAVDFINTVFDDFDQNETLLTQERFYQSTLKGGYMFSKRVFTAFKSSAQIISKSIISELFNHVDEQKKSQKKSFFMHMNDEIYNDINQLKNFKGSFVNLFHTALMFPLSTPYSLNSAMAKNSQKLNQNKIKSLQQILKVKRYPRAVKKINGSYCLDKYDSKRSLGKLFFEAFNLMVGDFENAIVHQFQLLKNTILFITKERYLIIDEEQLKIIFNVAKQDVSFVGIQQVDGKQQLKFKYCLDTKTDQKHNSISMKVLNLEIAYFESNFNEKDIDYINNSYNQTYYL